MTLPHINHSLAIVSPERALPRIARVEGESGQGNGQGESNGYAEQEGSLGGSGPVQGKRRGAQDEIRPACCHAQWSKIETRE